MATGKGTKTRTRGGFLGVFVRGYQFLQGVKYELQRVVWPTHEETTAFSTVVIIAVLAVAFYLGILDFIFAWIVEDLLHLY
jgi:preprotein translocase subunit SecE